MAAKKQGTQTVPKQELTATERTLLSELEQLRNQLARLERRQILTEEALTIVTNSVGFLLDLQTEKLPSLPEERDGKPVDCRCHAQEPSCGSTEPYSIGER